MPRKKRANNLPKDDSESWQLVLVRHNRQKTKLEAIVGVELNELPSWQSTATYSDQLSLASWVDGTARYDAQPWMIAARIARQNWVLLAGPALDDAKIARIGRRPKLQLLVAGLDGPSQRSYFRHYKQGKIQTDFSASGPPDGPLGKTKLKAPKLVAARVAKSDSPQQAIIDLLDEFDAGGMRFRLELDHWNAQLQKLDGKPVAKAALRELAWLNFYSLLPGENEASDRLDSALDEGDANAVKRALGDGADLVHLPERLSSPLARTVLSKNGDWQRCARELVKAGTPVDGEPGYETPLLCCLATFGSANVRGTSDGETIEAIELLLELGADINAKTYTSLKPGWTALQEAVYNNRLAIVKYLVSEGADLNIRTEDGKTALDMASRHAKGYKGEAKKIARAIVTFLKNAQQGHIDISDLDELVAQDAAAKQQKVDDAWARLELMHLQVVAQDALSQPDKITLTQLPNRKPPAQIARFMKQFVDYGFTELGAYQFTVGPVKIKIHALVNERDGLDAAVVRIDRYNFLYLARFHADGTLRTVSNLDDTGDLNAKATKADQPLVQAVRVPDGSVDELLKEMRKVKPPTGGIRATTAADFVERFETSYAVQIDQEKRIAKRLLAE